MIPPHRPIMQRAFVIGNGPSLRKTNLDLLVGEISFAVNHISDIYPFVKWRPTHYVRAEEATSADPSVYVADMELHVLRLRCQTWANTWFIKATGGLAKEPNFHTIVACPHYATHFDNQEAPHLWHMPLLCTFGSTVNVAIQIAIQQGYGPIYLLGCDLGYTEGGQNHYSDDYEISAGKLRAARYANMDTLAAHMVAARSSPVPIYNAGVGGQLEAYPRIKLEQLFRNKVVA